MASIKRSHSTRRPHNYGKKLPPLASLKEEFKVRVSLATRKRQRKMVVGNLALFT